MEIFKRKRNYYKELGMILMGEGALKWISPYKNKQTEMEARVNSSGGVDIVRHFGFVAVPYHDVKPLIAWLRSVYEKDYYE